MTSSKLLAEEELQVVGTPVQAQPLALDAGLGQLGALDEVEHDAPQDGEVLRTVAHAPAAVVLAEEHVEYPVAQILDAPVRADAAAELGRVERGRADVVAPLGAGAALVRAVDGLPRGLDHHGAADLRPETAKRLRHGAQVVGNHTAARVQAAVVLVHSDVLLPHSVLHVARRTVEHCLRGLSQRGLNVLGRQDEVGPARHDLPGNAAQAAQRVERDGDPRDVERIEQRRHGRDLVAFDIRARLRQRPTAGSAAARHQVHHRHLPRARTTHTLAVDGDGRYH